MAVIVVLLVVKRHVTGSAPPAGPAHLVVTAGAALQEEEMLQEFSALEDEVLQTVIRSSNEARLAVNLPHNRYADIGQLDLMEKIFLNNVFSVPFDGNTYNLRSPAGKNIKSINMLCHNSRQDYHCI